MTKKKKILLTSGIFFLLFLSWWVYQVMNPTPVDEGMSDACYAAGKMNDKKAMSMFCG